MIHLKSMPASEAAELLLFLAEQESFASSEKLLLPAGRHGEGGVTAAEIRTLLREIADLLMRDVASSVLTEAPVSRQAKEVLSLLTPSETRRLLDSFGIDDEE